MPLLELHGLTKYYGSVPGIIDLDLKINKGEILGFIGPNGAGKSTTLRLIMNLINKDGGEITFCGAPLSRNNRAAYRKIGYLPGEINLYGEMTVIGMLKYNAAFYDKSALIKARGLSELLCLEEKKRLDRLSAGSLKKVGIVLSLMHSPSLVIMDEPMESLDPPTRKAFREIIRSEKAAGTAFLFSSRKLSEAKELFDTVAFIKQGHLIKTLPAKELSAAKAVKVKLTTDDKLDSSLIISRRSGNEYTIISEKDINSLLRQLEKYKLEKLLIEEPSLEEIYTHYYR